jgi:hypothetical protein
LLLGLVSSASAAGEKDKDALKLHDQAINEDYLNADFPKATAKLKDALKKCGTDGCTPALVAKIHVSLGTIYGAGMSKLDQAKDEFILGLKADPTVTVDTSLTNPDLDKVFADAKKSAGGSGAAGAGGAGGAGTGPKKPPAADGDAGTHKAPPEQAVNTPVPIYMEPSDEQPTSKVTLRYKPFGSKTYKSVELKKMGKGFGGEIPCEDVTTTGDIKYFFALTDESGEAAGTLGTTKDPYKVTIKSEIEGEAPTLPGQKAPDQCKEKVDCPPGLPGCPAAGGAGADAGAKRGDKGWGASCEETQQCSEGLVCLNGACEEGKDDGTKKDKESKGGKRNLVSLGAQLDWLMVGSQSDVCSAAAAGSYACFISGTTTQFDGVIANKGGTNGVVGGGSFADVRVLAGYDRQLFANIPLTLGVRLGWAFGGSPTPDNVAADGFLKVHHATPANAFLGFHGEARAEYHFLGFFEKGKLRPYAFVGGGLAQVNAAVPIKVCNADGTGSATSCGIKSKPSAKLVDVDAYQITGLNFIGFGGGATYGLTANFGIQAELKMMIMVPTSGFVFAPTFGPVVGF